MRELAIQKVMKIRLFDMTTEQLKAELRKLNESSFTNGQETVFLTNGNGVNVASFDHSLAASISGSNSRVSGDLMALQVGSDPEELTDDTSYQYAETLTIDTDAAETEFEATGTADEEIGFAYVLDVNGNVTSTLEQGTTTSATEFTYDSGTKTITTSGLDDGTKVRVFYYPTASTLEKISNLTGKFSATCKVVADVMAKDVCTDQLVYGQLVADKGHVQGGFEWSLSEGGNPTMHDFQVDFLETCGDNERLWDFILVDKANLS